MAPSVATEASWSEANLCTMSPPEPTQRRRIMQALGQANRLPGVDDRSLARYYAYLSAQLSLPFAAHFPRPTDAFEEAEFRCQVIELLDPERHLGDGFDGIFCKVRKGRYELNLPLIELYLPEDDPNFQIIEDYWFWFWNWR
jgi:hypothetical protein